MCENSGWGKTSNEEPPAPVFPDELQVVTIPVVAQDTCTQIWEDVDQIIYDGEICAGDSNKGPCNVITILMHLHCKFGRRMLQITHFCGVKLVA